MSELNELRAVCKNQTEMLRLMEKIHDELKNIARNQIVITKLQQDWHRELMRIGVDVNKPK